jgi:hypothetical protein
MLFRSELDFNTSYDIQDKQGKWYTLGKLLKREKTYDHFQETESPQLNDFENSKHANRLAFEPMEEWYNKKIFRVTPVPSIDIANQIKTSIANGTLLDAVMPHMDDNNKKAAEVMKTQGMDVAVKHMFTEPKTGKPLTYSEMRYLYG